MRFLDLFMVWCVLADAPEMSSDELLCTRTNWNRVILEGRKPGLTLGIGCETAQYPLARVGKDLFRDLRRVAQRWIASTDAVPISRPAMSWSPASTIPN